MNSILTMEITMQAKTEYGLKGIQWLMEQVGKMNPDVMINTGDITIWLNRQFTPIKSNVSGVNVAVGKRNAEEANNNMADEVPEDTKQTLK
jgi:hypothetical protein